MSDPIVGIDLGTSNSVVAHADEAGVVRVLSDEAGYKIHPSVVSFHPSGGVVVGAAAKQRKVIDPANTIYSAKRLIGRSFRSPEVQTAKTRMPYQIIEGANQLPMIVTRGGEFAVPEISAIVLDHVRNVAAEQIGQDVSRAVVTVPASFNDAQRSATATAGAIAGLTIVRVLNEPTAAALAYGHTRSLRQIIAVYDFGGGTFDITILKLEDQVYEVLGTAGDTFLGGDDLDERLVDRMVAKFLAENRIDLRTNEVSMMRLRAVAEQTKIELSRRSRAVVRIDEIAYGRGGAPLNLQIEITRDEFVGQVADIIDRTFPVCQEALQLASLGIGGIDDVILVGGTTKIPYVRDQVSRFFAKAPRTDVNPEDAVAVGAALQAMSLERILGKTVVRPASGSDAAADYAHEEPTATGVDVDLGERAAAGTTQVAPPPEPPRAPKRSTAEYSALNRLPSAGSGIPIAALAAQAAADKSGPTRPPEKRPTGELRPTERAATRGGSVDRFEPSITPVPLARITRPAATPPPPTPPPTSSPSAKTMFGVPAAPSPRESTTEIADEPLPPSRRTAPSSVPPPPALTTLRGGPLPPPPSARPAGSSPTAATMMVTLPAAASEPSPASTNRGIAPPSANTAYLDLDESPASTAKGFSPPQTYPTTLPVAAPAPMPMPMPVPGAMPIAAPKASPVVLDVTPRGLGIGTVAGFCEELIRRNSRLPTEMRKLFTTSRDSQKLVRIVVCQGESRRLDSNVVIGDLLLDNLPARPRGETSIEVTFHLDASGILQVRARDAQTGREQHASLDVIGSVPQQDVAASRDRLQQLQQRR